MNAVSRSGGIGPESLYLCFGKWNYLHTCKATTFAQVETDADGGILSVSDQRSVVSFLLAYVSAATGDSNNNGLPSSSVNITAEPASDSSK